jgi:hypothetical protein
MTEIVAWLSEGMIIEKKISKSGSATSSSSSFRMPGIWGWGPGG